MRVLDRELRGGEGGGGRSCSRVHHPHLQLAHVGIGMSRICHHFSLIFTRTAPTAATPHQCQRYGWLTRSRFPAVALAPSQTGERGGVYRSLATPRRRQVAAPRTGRSVWNGSAQL